METGLRGSRPGCASSAMQNTFLGVLIAICGNSLIGSSFAVMKVAHMRNTDGGSYLRIPMWWFGTLLMILGELGNLVAYSLGVC